MDVLTGIKGSCPTDADERASQGSLRLGTPSPYSVLSTESHCLWNVTCTLYGVESLFICGGSECSLILETPVSTLRGEQQRTLPDSNNTASFCRKKGTQDQTVGWDVVCRRRKGIMSFRAIYFH